MREGNTTESGKIGGGRARGVGMRKNGLLAGTYVAKALFAISPTLAGFVAIPTLVECAVGGWLTGDISADVSTDVGKERGKGFSNVMRVWMDAESSAVRAEGPVCRENFFLASSRKVPLS